jgi:hypothetical protein
LADINNCHYRLSGAGDVGKDLFLPANCMKYVYQYHYSKHTLIGWMTNSPGELTGKLSNHVSQTFYLFLIVSWWWEILSFQVK